MQATAQNFPDLTHLSDTQLAEIHTYAIAGTENNDVVPGFLEHVEAERARRNPAAVPAAVTLPPPIGDDRRISQTHLRCAPFESATIYIDVENGHAVVTGISYHHKSDALWLSDVKTRHFGTVAAAEEFGAAWVDILCRRGWYRRS